jgi:hypothetical protein
LLLSLAPGFSQVESMLIVLSRFNGFLKSTEAIETA